MPNIFGILQQNYWGGNFFMKREKLIEQGYTPVKKSITFFQANFVGILPILPLVLIYIIGYACFYYFVRDKSIGFDMFADFIKSPLYVLTYLVITFVAIIIHEGLHALFFLGGCEEGRKSIVFGFKSGCPYCHCDEVLSIKRYINALWAPLWFLCSLLVVLSLIIDFLPLFLATATLIFGSCGDLYVWLLIRKHRKQNVFVWDMVDEVGCELFFEDDASKVSTTQSTTPSMSE